MTKPSLARLEEAAEQWRTDGWVLLEHLVPGDEVAAAIAELPQTEANPSLKGRRSRHTHADAPDVGAAFRDDQFSGTTLFPIDGAPALNRMMIHPNVLRFAEVALQSGDLRIYQSRLWSKYAGRVNYEQPLHCDRNHSLVPTRSEPGWWHIECFLYLTDVDEDTGAPRLVPRSLTEREPRGTRPVDRDDAPELYGAEVAAPGPAGSLLAYRSDVWHRGMDLRRPGAERHVLVTAFRLGGQEWIGFDPYPPLSIHQGFKTFVADCSPRELAVFGVPLPGHGFWTDQTLDGMAELYPGLDLEPWRVALDDR